MLLAQPAGLRIIFFKICAKDPREVEIKILTEASRPLYTSLALNFLSVSNVCVLLSVLLSTLLTRSSFHEFNSDTTDN